MSTLEELEQRAPHLVPYVRIGWKLHPLGQRSKSPKVKGWNKLASCDPKQLLDWLDEFGDNTNWGVACGSPSGVTVVDIDPRHGGDITWRKWVIKYGEPEGAVIAKTGGGGVHYYFENFRAKNGKIGPGVDIKSDGGQVVIPPSTHPNGGTYYWEQNPFNGVQPPPAPSWVKDLAKGGEYDSVGTSMEKGNRNNSIFNQAVKLFRQGAEREFVHHTMLEWVQSQGENVGEDEVRKTVESAYEYAKDEQLKGVLERSEDHVALAFLDLHADNLLYAEGLGWMTWDGKRWKAGNNDGTASATQLLLRTLRQMQEDAVLRSATADSAEAMKLANEEKQWLLKTLSSPVVKHVLELASTDPRVRVPMDALDSVETRNLINFKNGTFDITTGELRDHRREDMITTLVDVRYDPDATAPFWEETLSLAFEGNEELIDFTHRSLGYSVTGSINEQCLFICWGPDGNNGKSTILETVQRVLGQDYVIMSDVKVITSNSNNDSYAQSSLARMRGARVVNMNESEDFHRLNESLVKQMTGGDTITAKSLYKDAFQFTPQFKIWIRTNERPVIRSQGEAIWRRVKLIPFEHPIPAEKRKPRQEVDAILDAEKEGIVAWLMRGAMKWREHGLGDPVKVKEAVEDYRDDSDIVRAFTDEVVLDEPNGRLRLDESYVAFCSWALNAGEKYIMPRKEFAKRMARRFSTEWEKIGGKQVMRGHKLSEEFV